MVGRHSLGHTVIEHLINHHQAQKCSYSQIEMQQRRRNSIWMQVSIISMQTDLPPFWRISREHTERKLEKLTETSNIT